MQNIYTSHNKIPHKILVILEEKSFVTLKIIVIVQKML